MNFLYFYLFLILATKKPSYSSVGHTHSVPSIVVGNVGTPSNGSIGIVPFVYKDAYNYYLSIFLANDQNKNITFSNDLSNLLSQKVNYNNKREYNYYS